MSAPLLCPSAEQLESLLEGKVSEPRLSTLVQHLETCSLCQDRARTLAPNDTLVAVLQSTSPEVDRIADGMPPPLVEKLKSLAAPQQEKSSDTVAFAAEDSPTTNPDLAFLAPPQREDELGRLGHHRILRVLGQGGMGIVFLADDLKLERQVALKVMLPRFAAEPQAKQRFLREARAAAKLRSDHIVTIYQVDEERGVPFLAMELLEGMPLDVFLQSGEQLQLSQILRIGQEIAKGLAAAHEKGLIHRDIKPGNIWLENSSLAPLGRGVGGEERITPSPLVGEGRGGGDASSTPLAPLGRGVGGEGDGRVKILDFGLARAQKDDVQLTQSGAIVGTPAYMAPEQARADRAVDARADLFSLGCVLYRLCAGDIPFKGETTIGLLLAVATTDPLPPHRINEQIPTPLSELILQLLNKDPAQRPESARAVIARLQEIEQAQVEPRRAPPTSRQVSASSDSTQAELSPAPPSEPPTTPAPRRRRPVVMALACGAVAGLLALLGGIIYIATDQGTIEIDTADRNVKVIVENAGGKATILDPLSKQTWVLNTGQYTIRLDGNPDGLEIDLPKGRVFEMKRGGKQVVAIRRIEKEGLPPIASLPGPWQSLFNGKDLSGWVPHTAPGRAGNWRVEQGVLVGAGPFDNAYLVSERNFSDFHLRLEARVNSEEADSGVFLRTDPVGPGADCLEVNLSVDPAVTGQTGSLYHNRIKKLWPAPRALARPNEWFTLEIIAIGPRILTRVNGNVAIDAQLVNPRPTGRLLLQQRGPQTVVQFRKIEIKEPEGRSAGAFALQFAAGSQSLVQVPRLALERRGPWTVEAVVTVTENVKPNGAMFPLNLGFSPLLSLRAGLEPNLTVLQAGEKVTVVKGPALKLRQRYHLAAVRNGPSLQLFVDGRSAGQQVTGAEPILGLDDKLTMGVLYSGLLSEVRISKTARYGRDFTPVSRFEPDNDTLALYHCDEGEGDKLTDSSGHGHHGKIVGAKWVQANQPLRASSGLRFTGQVDRVEVAGLKDPGGDITVEAFATLTAAQPGTHAWVIRYGEGDVDGLFAGATYLKVRPKPSWNVGSVFGPEVKAAAHLDQKTHVAFVRKAQLLQLYVNGQLAGSQPDDLQRRPGGELILGGGFAGILHQVRVTKKARYGKDFTPPAHLEKDGDTIGLYLFQDGVGDQLTDHSGGNHHGLIFGARWVWAEETPTDHDRRVAGWVLSLGGTVRVKGMDRDLKAVQDLPRTPFTLLTVDLNKKALTDTGLANLQPLRGLKNLHLTSTALTDAGLSVLDHLPELEQLWLHNTAVTDATLTRLRQHVRLQILNVRKTRVTLPGLRDFHAAVPGCRIDHDGGVIEPTKPVTNSERRAAESLTAHADLTVRLLTGSEVTIQRRRALPAESFTVVGIQLKLEENSPPGFAEEVLLPAVRELKGLRTYWDINFRVLLNEAAFDQFAAMPSAPQLTSIFGRIWLNPQTVAAAAKLPNLESISFDAERADDVALVRLGDLKKTLTQLTLINYQRSNKSTAEGWKAVTALPLRVLGLGNPVGLKAADWRQVAGMLHLRQLSIWKCAAEQLDLREIAQAPTIRELLLVATPISDADLGILAGMKNLERLHLAQTNVTTAAIQKLAVTLPRCRIEWDGKVIEPKNGK